MKNYYCTAFYNLIMLYTLNHVVFVNPNNVDFVYRIMGFVESCLLLKLLFVNLTVSTSTIMFPVTFNHVFKQWTVVFVK